MTSHVEFAESLPMHDRLENLIHERLGSRIRDLRIVIRHQGVILEGRAPTYHVKQLAQHAAMEIGRLPILANNIQVR